MTFLVVVPGNPKPKQRPRFARGKAYRADRSDEEVVAWHARQVFGNRRLEGDVALRATFYRKDRTRVDADNLGKLCLDGLNGVAWRDDSQVKDLRLRIEYDAVNPRTVIEIEGEVSA